MVTPEEAKCSGRDAVTLERKQATSVPANVRRRVGCSGELAGRYLIEPSDYRFGNLHVLKRSIGS